MIIKFPKKGITKGKLVDCIDVEHNQCGLLSRTAFFL